jgi:putative SOS response-associated peptidase YedK
MCGRYQLLRPEDIAARFETVNALPDLVASDDVRPTQSIPVVAMGRKLTLMQWGFVPSWAKERPRGAPLINARAEGIETPASGGKKVRYLFTREDGDFLALAGLYDTRKTPEGHDLRSCVIITTTPIEVVAPIHDLICTWVSRPQLVGSALLWSAASRRVGHGWIVNSK